MAGPEILEKKSTISISKQSLDGDNANHRCRKRTKEMVSSEVQSDDEQEEKKRGRNKVAYIPVDTAKGSGFYARQQQLYSAILKKMDESSSSRDTINSSETPEDVKPASERVLAQDNSHTEGGGKSVAASVGEIGVRDHRSFKESYTAAVEVIESMPVPNNIVSSEERTHLSMGVEEDEAVQSLALLRATPAAADVLEGLAVQEGGLQIEAPLHSSALEDATVLEAGLQEQSISALKEATVRVTGAEGSKPMLVFKKGTASQEDGLLDRATVFKEDIEDSVDESLALQVVAPTEVTMGLLEVVEGQKLGLQEPAPALMIISVDATVEGVGPKEETLFASTEAEDGLLGVSNPQEADISPSAGNTEAAMVLELEASSEEISASLQFAEAAVERDPASVEGIQEPMEAVKESLALRDDCQLLEKPTEDREASEDTESQKLKPLRIESASTGGTKVTPINNTESSGDEAPCLVPLMPSRVLPLKGWTEGAMGSLLWIDPRVCGLCQEGGVRASNDPLLGRMLPLQDGSFAHVNCLRWSLESIESSSAIQNTEFIRTK